MDAVNAHDVDAIVDLVHTDFVGESLQSGERSRGRDGFRAQIGGYPGTDENPITVDRADLYGDEERWAISPGYTVVPLASPNNYTVVFRTRYPDGSWWRIILVVELRDEMLYRMQSYYAPELPAPLAESIAAFSRRD